MPKEALIIIDMLEDFVRKGAPLEVPSNRDIIPNIRREIESVHRHGNRVIYICDNHDPDDKEFSRYGWPAHAVAGTEGSNIVTELQPSAKDIVIRKKTYSSFYNTTLDETLQRLEIDTLILTGCVSHICILFTAVEAVPRGYFITVPADAIGWLTREDHDAALRIMKNVLGAKIV